MMAFVLSGGLVNHHVGSGGPVSCRRKVGILRSRWVRMAVDEPNTEPDGGTVQQLLGVRGAQRTENKWRIRLQLMKPVTWVPLVWGVMCGAAASGNFQWNPDDVSRSLLCMFMAGPLLTGFTQTMNDWYDREMDAINEPYRPIPSGAISEGEVKGQILGLLAASLGVSVALDQWCQHDTPVVLMLTLFGILVSYNYSAPPLKFKQNGWIGTYALGASYISLPWWAGQAVFGQLDWKVMVFTLFYSFAGLGIATVNDFKSIEGDAKLGLKSLPVAFGIDTAKWIAAGMIDIFQFLAAGVILSVGETAYGLAMLGLLMPQMYFQQKYLLNDPVKYDVKYQASAQPFLVMGILVAGLAIGHHGPL